MSHITVARLYLLPRTSSFPCRPVLQLLWAHLLFPTALDPSPCFQMVQAPQESYTLNFHENKHFRRILNKFVQRAKLGGEREPEVGRGDGKVRRDTQGHPAHALAVWLSCMLESHLCCPVAVPLPVLCPLPTMPFCSPLLGTAAHSSRPAQCHLLREVLRSRGVAPSPVCPQHLTIMMMCGAFPPGELFGSKVVANSRLCLQHPGLPQKCLVSE